MTESSRRDRFQNRSVCVDDGGGPALGDGRMAWGDDEVPTPVLPDAGSTPLTIVDPTAAVPLPPTAPVVLLPVPPMLLVELPSERRTRRLLGVEL